MKAEQITALATGHQGAWFYADRRFFEEHPDRAWYLRAPSGEEFDDPLVPDEERLHRNAVLLALRDALAHPNTPASAELAVLVVQRPGVGRVRMPAIRLAGDDEHLLIVDDTGRLSKIDTEQAATAAGASRVADVRLPDDCPGCGKPYRTGDVTFVFGAQDRCAWCALPVVRSGERLTALTAYVSNADGPPSQWSTELRQRHRRAVELIARFSKSPSPTTVRDFLSREERAAARAKR